jgi:hypothetical protein
MAERMPILRLSNWLGVNEYSQEGQGRQLREYQGLLFDAGGEAKSNGIPFDFFRTSIIRSPGNFL